MSILGISKQFKQRPSEIIRLTNDYESFCFDEACTYILSKLQEEDGPKPRFDDEEKPQNNDNMIEWMKSNNRN